MGDGRLVAQALRHLHTQGSEPDAPLVARELAFFLVARCEARHAGWRVLRQVVMDAGAQEVPWEKCARRAVPAVADDLLQLSQTAGRVPLAGAQHLAAQRRAQQLARHVEPVLIFKELGIVAREVTLEEWGAALMAAVGARSREQVARFVAGALGVAAAGVPEPLFVAGPGGAR